MLKLIKSRIFWGILLVLGGAILLLDTLGIFEGNALFWTASAFIAGALFVTIFLTNRDHWWALIPGVIFIGLAAAIGLDAYLPGFNDANLAGPVILASIALSFFLVYIVDNSNWWALIPAGVMTTLAIVAVIDTSTSMDSGGIFFLGLGFTFALVALLPNSAGKMKWAWIPAAILGIIGFLIVIAAENLINYVWPVVLIIVGFVLVARSLWKK